VKLAIISVLVLIINLPFGFWRSRVRKFSWKWILAVHAPVPAVVALRLASGLGFQLISYPLLVGAYFTGQLCGGRAGGYFTRRTATLPESTE
jgi:hypothetical protein